MSITIPNEIPEEGDVIIYKTDTVQIVVESEYNGSIPVRMYLENHEQFENIIPDDIANCQHYEDSEGCSSVSELPSKYCKLFIEATEQLMKKHNLRLKYPGEGYGICTRCLPNGEHETLVFISHLKKCR